MLVFLCTLACCFAILFRLVCSRFVDLVGLVVYVCLGFVFVDFLFVGWCIGESVVLGLVGCGCEFLVWCFWLTGVCVGFD